MLGLIRQCVGRARGLLQGAAGAAIRAGQCEVASPSQPVTFASLAVFVVSGGALLAYYNYIKQQKIAEMVMKSQKSSGKAQVGGPFALIDQDGRPFTDKDLLGEFSILYFGFCSCPDICPDELEKLATSLDTIEKEVGVQVSPVYITVDPERDTPKVMKEYVQEFHPRLIGLTGPMDAIKSLAKLYRVYFIKTNDSPDDYLVDHSIIMYLLDPDGEFVTFFGKNYTDEQLAQGIMKHIKEWKASHPDYKMGSK